MSGGHSLTWMRRHRDEIRDMWNADRTAKEIAQKLGTNEQAVSQRICAWRRQEGEGKWPKRRQNRSARIGKAEKEAIRQRLKAGEVAARIAPDFNVHAATLNERIARWRAAEGEGRWPRSRNDPRGAGGKALAEGEDAPEIETPRSIAGTRGGPRIRLMKELRGVNNDIVYVVTVQALPHGATVCSSANVVRAREICDSAAQAAEVFAMFWRAASSAPSPRAKPDGSGDPVSSSLPGGGAKRAARSLGAAQDRAARQGADA